MAVIFVGGCEGPVGPEGPAGPRGEQGIQGERGEPGRDGRDQDNITVISQTAPVRNDGFTSWTVPYELSDGIIVNCWLNTGEGTWIALALDIHNPGNGPVTGPHCGIYENPQGGSIAYAGGLVEGHTVLFVLLIQRRL